MPHAESLFQQQGCRHRASLVYTRSSEAVQVQRAPDVTTPGPDLEATFASRSSRVYGGSQAYDCGDGQQRDYRMTAADHFRITASALKRWAIAQLQDSLAVGLLWLLGLWIIGVPWAPLWALLAAMLQIVPHFGPILGLLGPVLAATLHWHDWQHPLYVLYSLCGDCRGGWIPASALHHAPRGASARVGLNSSSARPGICDSILGISARATVAGGGVCVQGAANGRLVREHNLWKSANRGCRPPDFLNRGGSTYLTKSLR